MYRNDGYKDVGKFNGLKDKIKTYENEDDKS